MADNRAVMVSRIFQGIFVGAPQLDCGLVTNHVSTVGDP